MDDNFLGPVGHSMSLDQIYDGLGFNTDEIDYSCKDENINIYDTYTSSTNIDSLDLRWVGSSDYDGMNIGLEKDGNRYNPYPPIPFSFEMIAHT